MKMLGLTITVERSASRQRWTRRVVAMAAVGALTLGGGVAYAYWSTTGTGSGTAQAGQALALSTVSATASTTGLLVPGGSGDLKVTFDNPNSFPVKITAVSAGSGAIGSSGGIGTCTTTGVSIVGQTGLSLVVPAKAGTDGQLTTTMSGAVQMDNTSDTGCQNATFTVPISFTGTSN